MTTCPARCVLGLLLLGLGASAAEGRWLPGSIADRVRSCDLVVVGRLGDVESLGAGLRRDWGGWMETRRSRGVIVVERAIWGDSRAGDRLTLSWEDRIAKVCAPFCLHERHDGETGIWLLTRQDDGTFLADNTFWFLDLDDEAKVREALRQDLVILHQEEWELFRGARYEVSLVVRNPGEAPMTIPRLSIADGRLIAGEGVTLRVEFVPRDNDWQPVAAREGLVAVSGETLTIDSGREHRLDVDLREYFEMDERDGYYRARFAIEGVAGEGYARWIVWDEDPPRPPILAPSKLRMVPVPLLSLISVAFFIWVRRRHRRAGLPRGSK